MTPARVDWAAACAASPVVAEAVAEAAQLTQAAAYARRDADTAAQDAETADERAARAWAVAVELATGHAPGACVPLFTP